MVIRNGILYVGNTGGEIHAFEAATGTPMWGTPYQTGDGPVKGFLWPVHGSSLLYYSTDSQVNAISDSGAVAVPYWNQPVSVPDPSTPLVFGGRAYVGSRNGIFSIDAVSTSPGAPDFVAVGDPSRQSRLGAPAFDGLANLLLAGSDEGILYGVKSFP